MVQDICKAALEPERYSLGKPESLVESQVQIDRPRADQISGSAVAKHSEGVRATKRRRRGGWGTTARTGERAVVPIVVCGWVRDVAIAHGTRTLPTRATRLGARAGGVTGNPRGEIRSSLKQENAAQLPTADDSVYHPVGVPQNVLALANRKFIQQGCDPAMSPRGSDVPPIRVAVKTVQRSAIAFLSAKKGTGERGVVRQVVRPSPSRLERKSIRVFVDQLGLHGVVPAGSAAGAGIDKRPVREWSVGPWPVRVGLGASTIGVSRKWERLIDIGSPSELNPSAADIGHPEGGVTVEGSLGREVPLNRVGVLLIELIRSFESLRAHGYIERIADLNVGKLKPRRVAIAARIGVRCLKSIVNARNGIKHRPQSSHAVHTDPAAHYCAIASKRPIGKTETRAEVRVSFSQALRPTSRLGRQKGSARHTVNRTQIERTPIDILEKERLRRGHRPWVRRYDHPARNRDARIKVGVIDGIIKGRHSCKPHTKVQGQLWRDLEGILSIGVIVVCPAVDQRSRMGHIAVIGNAHKKIGKVIT